MDFEKLKKLSQISSSWPFQEARKIYDKHSSVSKPYIGFESGFGPSGHPHIGTLFESIRTGMVQKAFEHLTGLPTKLFIVSDDLDALRKIPGDMPNQNELASWLGTPLSKVPDPYEQASSYSEAMTNLLAKMLEDYELDYELVSSSNAYASGIYNETIKNILKNYEHIDKIVRGSVGQIRQETYGLLMPISPFSGKVIEHLKITDINPQEGSYTYLIPSDSIIQKKGVNHGLSAAEYYPDDPLDQEIKTSALNGQSKLQWKVDWPMRMVSRNIAYEMHGEDLEPAANLATKICRILDAEPPVLYKHGLILDGNGHKISKSKGNGLSLEQAKKYLSSDMMSYLAYQKPNLQRKFYPGMIPSLYSRHDSDVSGYKQKSLLEQMNSPLFHTKEKSTYKYPTFNFPKLVNIISNFSPDDNTKLKPILQRVLSTSDESSIPKDHAFIDAAFDYYTDFVKPNKINYSPNEEEKKALKVLSHRIDALSNEATDDEFQTAVFDTAREVEWATKDMFRLAYLSILGQDFGPRFSSLVSVYGKNHLSSVLKTKSAETHISLPKPANDNEARYRNQYVNNIKVQQPTSEIYRDPARLPNRYSLEREANCHAKIMQAIFSSVIDASVEDWSEYLANITNSHGKNYLIPELAKHGGDDPKMVALLAGQSSGKTTFKKIFYDQNIVSPDSTVSMSTGLMLGIFPETSEDNLTTDQKEDRIAQVRDEILHLQRLATQIALANNISVVLDIHIIEKEQADALCDIAQKEQAASILFSPYINIDTYAQRVTARAEKEGRLPFKDEHILFHQIFSYNFDHHFRFLFDECLLIDNNEPLEKISALKPVYYSQKCADGKIQELVYDNHTYSKFLAKKNLEPDVIQQQINFISKQKGLSHTDKISKIKTFLRNVNFELEKSAPYPSIEALGGHTLHKINPFAAYKILQSDTPITSTIVDKEAKNQQILVAQFKKASPKNQESNDKPTAKLPGTISTSAERVKIIRFSRLPQILQDKILEKLPSGSANDNTNTTDLEFKRYEEKQAEYVQRKDLTATLGKLIKAEGIFTDNKLKDIVERSIRNDYKHSTLAVDNFTSINLKVTAYAQHLRSNKEHIADALKEYECYNVAIDEIDRSIELLENLEKNRSYFTGTIGGVTTFLPLNQPLYATVCFGIIPSFLSSDVSLRPPTAMQNIYSKLQKTLNLETFFPNMNISYDSKEGFVAKRCKKTDAVIFTGTPENGNKVRKQFPKNTLFILNGAGHNPLVITETAEISLSVDSAIRTVLQNQGQDCAGPNAILVHASQTEKFQKELLGRLQALESLVGEYSDKNNIVGPNTDPDHTLKIAKIFAEMRVFHRYGGDINPVTGMIKPTIFEKPLTSGPNHKEFFAPVFMVQTYEQDHDLSLYFEHNEYSKNAMYISVFGDSPYIDSLIDKGLHNETNILRNTDLHLEEKGYMPYGGFGAGASCIYMDGIMIRGATLPQRDIFEYLIKPRDHDHTLQYGFKKHDDGYYEIYEPN